MKTLIALSLFLLLSGCSALSKFIPSNFDNVEYGMLVELNVIASSPLVEDNWCNDSHLNRMAYISRQLKVYSEHRLNENIANIYSEIDSLAMELRNRKNPSTTYCKIKRNNIHKITNETLSVFGDRKS